MSHNRFFTTVLCIAFSLILLVFIPEAFPWGGPSHSSLATILLNEPTVAPFINEFGVDANSVKSWTSEPPDEWHHPGWDMLNRRGYLGIDNGMDWTSLSETTRLRYLIHIAVDCGVPLGHSPANAVYTNKVAEAQLEAQVATWSSYPSIVGQTGYQHESTGYTASFTGTYSEILTKFYGACINNASWYKGKENILGLHSTDTNRRAGWCGTTIGLYLGRAMLVDYFLAKRTPLAVANGPYVVSPGGSVTLSSSGSQDPDSVTWLSNGTYVNNGGGIVSIAWDLNNDGTYETSGANPTLSYNSLYALLGPGQKTIRLKVVDDEGKVGYGTTTLMVYTNPTASGATVYNYMGKTGDVPSGWDWNILSATASDPDGGGITAYEWDLNNDGVTDMTGQNVTVWYSDFVSLGITANENQTVTLTVTDNAGLKTTVGGIRCPILTNPTCSLNANYSIDEIDNDSLTITATGSDPDGGAITQWLWDLDNDGRYDDATGQTLTLTWPQLIASGMKFGKSNTIGLKVIDNDAAISGSWAGTAKTTATIELTSKYQVGDYWRRSADWTMNSNPDDDRYGTPAVWAYGWDSGTFESWSPVGMTWNGKYWFNSGACYSRVGIVWMYPAVGKNSSVRWTSPVYRTIAISGTIYKPMKGSNGVIATIGRQTVDGMESIISSYTLDSSCPTTTYGGVTCWYVTMNDIVLPVLKGENLFFQVDSAGDNTSDLTYFDPKITIVDDDGETKSLVAVSANDSVSPVTQYETKNETNDCSASYQADVAIITNPETVTEKVSDEEETATSICSEFGLPIVAGLFLTGLMLVKLEE
jgi:hypothetical protein